MIGFDDHNAPPGSVCEPGGVWSVSRRADSNRLLQAVGLWELALLRFPDADVVEVDRLIGHGEVEARFGFVSQAR